MALQDQSWMPMPWAYKFDPITTDWTYVRPALSALAKGGSATAKASRTSPRLGIRPLWTAQPS